MTLRPLVADLSVDHEIYRPVEHIAPFMPEGFLTWSPQEGEEGPNLKQVSHVILSGSTASIVHPPEWITDVESLVRVSTAERIPLLGICFGHQLIARTGMGKVRRTPTPELGWFEHERQSFENRSFRLPRHFFAYMAHLDDVTGLPTGFEVLAATPRCPVAAMAHCEAPILGLQFHPELPLDLAIEVQREFPVMFPAYQAAVVPEFAEPRDDGLGEKLFADFLKL